jgi:hypothetical protein
MSPLSADRVVSIAPSQQPFDPLESNLERLRERVS